MAKWWKKIKIFSRGKNPKPIATLTVQGRSKKDVHRRALRIAKHHLKNVRVVTRDRKNVEQGFWDSTGFHPIRASKDYSMARAGERRARSYRARATRLRSATRRGTIVKG